MRATYPPRLSITGDYVNSKIVDLIRKNFDSHCRSSSGGLESVRSLTAILPCTSRGKVNPNRLYTDVLSYGRETRDSGEKPFLGSNWWDSSTTYHSVVVEC